MNQPMRRLWSGIGSGKAWVLVSRLGLAILAMVGFALVLSSPSWATTDNWSGSEPVYAGTVDSLPSVAPSCINQELPLDRLASPHLATVCLRDHGDWSYGHYQYYLSPFLNGFGTALRLKDDPILYRVNQDILNYDWLYIDIGDSDDVIRLVPTGRFLSYHFYLYRNLPTKFTAVKNGDFGKIYNFNDDATDFRLARPDGTILTVHGVALSNNHKWAVMEVRDIGLVRINLETLEVMRFANDIVDRSDTIWPAPSPELAISNDGRYAMLGGWNTGYKTLYKLIDGCGDQLQNNTTHQTPIAQSCQQINLRPIINANPAAVHSAMRLSFSDDGRELAFELRPMSDSHALGAFVKLTISHDQSEELPSQSDPGDDGDDDGEDESRLSYLALGDSYSSGEGDVGKKADGSSYYLPGTEKSGACHLSERSYPFLLRASWGIETDKMKSVACSGAEVVMDMTSRVESYVGQHKELSGIGRSEAATARQKALDNFEPGVVPQIEFVKKYQPKLITLTGGGNDVGFGQILEYCAGFTWETLAYQRFSDCGYAKAGSKLEELLYNAIDTQYSYNKRLIDMVKQASPKTKIITVGYPSFISSTMPICSLTLNAGFLSIRERQMLNEAVNYMNKMLMQLAHDTETHFVNIENSLNDGRLCEGSGYVTGLVSAKGHFDVNNQIQSFHPNAKGHQQIAASIRSSRVFEDGNVPGTSGYVSKQSNTVTMYRKIAKGGWFTFGTAVRIAFDPLTFVKDSLVSITGYSEEVSLGEYQANSDGSFDVEVKTDSLPMGNHVIVLSGTSDSGQLVNYYQFVHVVSQKTADIIEGKLTSSSSTGKSDQSLIDAAPTLTVNDRFARQTFDTQWTTGDVVRKFAIPKGVVGEPAENLALENVPRTPNRDLKSLNGLEVYLATILATIVLIIGVVYAIKKRS